MAGTSSAKTRLALLPGHDEGKNVHPLQNLDPFRRTLRPPCRHRPDVVRHLLVFVRRRAGQGTGGALSGQRIAAVARGGAAGDSADADMAATREPAPAGSARVASVANRALLL